MAAIRTEPGLPPLAHVIGWPPCPLRVATDCSGIDSVIHTLRRSGIPIEHVFASDVDAAALAVGFANHGGRFLATSPRAASCPWFGRHD